MREFILQTRKDLSEPVDGSLFGIFRIYYGLVLFIEAFRHFFMHQLERSYLIPKFNFYYEFLPVTTPSPNVLYAMFVIMSITSLMMALGLFFRFACSLHLVLYTFVFLIEKTEYNNHYYLIILLTAMLLCCPAASNLSLDNWRKKQPQRQWIPKWCILIFWIEFLIVYFYAGIAKINVDWVNAEPVHTWLKHRSDLPIIGQYFHYQLTGFFFAYGGLVFDLLIGYTLIHKKLRYWSIPFFVFFHGMNRYIFSIGVFPIMMLGTLALYFPTRWFFKPLSEENKSQVPLISKVGTAVLVIFFALQILLPLRHWLYPSYPAWSDEGHRFAWRMKLRSKNARSVRFYVTDPKTGIRRIPDIGRYISKRQIRKMSTRPDMILQFAKFLKKELEAEGMKNPIITARTWVSLHGRRYRPLIDPKVNLAETPTNIIWPDPWITKYPEFEDPKSWTKR